MLMTKYKGIKELHRKGESHFAEGCAIKTQLRLVVSYKFSLHLFSFKQLSRVHFFIISSFDSPKLSINITIHHPAMTTSVFHDQHKRITNRKSYWVCLFLVCGSFCVRKTK